MSGYWNRCAVVLALGLSLSRVGAVSSQVIDPDFPVVDFPPARVLLFGDTLYVGGDITYLGPATGPLVSIDPETGVPNPFWPKVTGEILAVEPDGSGGCFVGVSGVASYSGVLRAALAHVRADGTLDDVECHSLFPTVRALKKVGSRLYVSGYGLTDGPGIGHEIGYFDLESMAYTKLAITDEHVSDMLVHDGVLYVTGSFWTFAGVPRRGLAGLELETGTVTTNTLTIDGPASSLDASGDTIWVGGNFGVGGSPAVNLAAFDARTGARLFTSLRSDIVAKQIASDGSSIYVVGYIPLGDGSIQAGIAAWDHGGRPRPEWTPALTSYPRSNFTSFVSIAVSDGVVHVGGTFDLANGTERHNLVALSSATGATLPWTCHAGHEVGGVVSSGDRLLAWSHGGYSISSFGGSVRRGVGAIDVRTKRVLDWRPSLESGWTRPQVFDIARVGQRVFLAGYFEAISGQFHLNLAAVDAISATPDPASLDITLGSAPSALLACDSVLYVGGDFAEVSRQPRTGLASLDLRTMLWTNWAPRLSWGPESMPSLLPGALNMVALDSTVIVNGLFAYANGQPRAATAEFDARTGALTEYRDPTSNERWDALRVGSDLWYVGAGAGPRARPALEFIPLEGPPDRLTTGLESFGTMKALARQGDVVWVTGSFSRKTDWNSAEADSVAQMTAIDIASHQDLGWSRPFYYPSDNWWAGGVTIAANATEVYAGGAFALVEGLGAGMRTLIRMLRPDSLAPLVAFTAPIGGETVVTGAARRVSWESGDDRGVGSADLYLSTSGDSGPWNLLAAGVRGRSWYDWNVTTREASERARLRIVVRDWDGKQSTATSGDFSIVDAATATWVESFALTRLESGVRVEWSLGDPLTIEGTAIERAASLDGEFVRVTGPIEFDGRRYSLVDGGASEDRAWWYRLRVRSRDGSSFVTAPVEVRGAALVREFALSVIAPNPTRRRSRMAYDVPATTRVRITVMDILGRERARLVDGERAAGRHAAELDVSDLPPGLYWLRLQAVGADVRRKLVIVR